jgi:drug/metabolite transporter (DMT)-like permease
MPSTVAGLPVHPLIIHATVVFVPLTALALVLSVVSPRFRAWAGPLPLALAVVSLVLDPLSTSTGENLEHMVGETPAVQHHAHLADMLIWWVLAMLVVAAATYFLHRRRRPVGKGLAVTLAVVGVVAAGGTVVQTVLIGHSGAEAAWSGVADHQHASAHGNG